MIDTHCHLTHEQFAADLEDVMQRAQAAGVERCVTIGTGYDDAVQAVALAQRFPAQIACAAGIDPFSAHEAGEAFPLQLEQLRGLAQHGQLVAIGEIGLDYHYDLAPRPQQREQLVVQLQLASELALPVVIHVREAHADLAAILADFPRQHGVIHSFTGGVAEAEAYLALGWSLAFNGIATFANAQAIRDAAAIVPDDRLLVETDSPYLAPVPKRGRRCEPAFVAHVLEAVARLRQTELAELVALTTTNARKLFRLA